jgi:hypothetical protein
MDGCTRLSVLCCPVEVEVLRQTHPPFRESYQMWNWFKCQKVNLHRKESNNLTRTIIRTSKAHITQGSPLKIRSTPSFGWEVKPEAACHKILRHVKDPLTYLRYWFTKFLLLRPYLLLAQRYLCWKDCQRALVDESGVFSSWHHHNGSPRSHITWGMNNRPVRGRSSET